MDIVCLLGSPRPKGNSATVAARFCETAENLGARVRTFLLNKLEYKGCQACMACKTKLETCAQKDDLTEVIEAVRECDVLVMATPVYCGDISSQLKGFVDRSFCYAVPDYVTNPNPSRLSPGKRMVFIQSQEQPDETQFTDIFARYDGMFKFVGFGESFYIHACGVCDVGDVNGRQELLKKAKETAEAIMVE